MYTDLARNNMLDGIGATHLSAHTAYSATGANEVTGGTPAYARKAVSYSAAASAAKAASTNPVFDIPAGTTVRFIGFWTGLAGSFLGMIANGGSENEFKVDPATDVFTVPAHGYADTQKVVFYGDTVPAGLTEGTVYFVRDSTTNTFKVAATSGGVAIDITAEPGRKCVVSAIVEEAFGAQGTLTVNAQTHRLDA